MNNRDLRWIRERRHRLYGANQRAIKKAWQSVGGSYRPVAKTGETAFTHPLLERPIVQGRSKNASRALVRTLIRLSERTEGGDDEQERKMK